MLIRQDYQWEGQDSGYDSVSTYVFPDDATAEAAWASPAGEALRVDTPLFMDWDAVVSYPGTDTVVYLPAK
jgi:hypothetical protein